jgi:hypothetical protein
MIAEWSLLNKWLIVLTMIYNAYGLQHADCVGVVFYSVTCVLVAGQSTNGKPMATVGETM